jgi:tetratricopeptide (TPR) repeat protein
MQSHILFTNYIIAGVEASLARVRAATYVVPEADRQQAWQILSFAFKLEEAWPVTRALLLALAPKMEMAGFREEWIPYLEKGIQCAQRVGDELAVAECKLQIGILYRLLSRFEEARQWLAEAISHFIEHGNVNGEARVLNEVAWLDHLIHRYQNATQHAENALALLTDNHSEKAMSYRIQGMIAFYQGNLQEATSYHRKALQIFKRKQEERRVAWSLQNLAIALQWQNQFEEAFDCYKKAIAHLTRLGDISNLGIAQMNLGSAYYHSENSLEAVKYFTSAKTIAHKLNDRLQLARINTHFGLAYLSLESYGEAEKAFQTSIDYYLELKDYSWQLNAMDGLAMTYIKSQQYEKAVAILNQAIDILPRIVTVPNYEYLRGSLTKHLKEAEERRG